MQKLSNNVVHGQNIALMAAMVELGTQALLESLDVDASATTLNGEFLTEQDFKEAIASRIAAQLGV